MLALHLNLLCDSCRMVFSVALRQVLCPFQLIADRCCIVFSVVQTLRPVLLCYFSYFVAGVALYFQLHSEEVLCLFS